MKANRTADVVLRCAPISRFNAMTNRQLIMAFVDAINARAPETLAELMTDDHTFIDAHGNEVIGREKMLAGWRGYFEWFPDYQIEVVQIFRRMRSSVYSATRADRSKVIRS